MASIANLIVSMIADVGKFETDMTRTSKQQAARMKKMEQEAAKAGKAVAGAFTAATAAMTAMVYASTKTADEMQKMSQRTGLSTEELSKYKHVTDLADVSIEQFGKGIGKMQRSLVDASNGLVTQQRAFDRLGLSVDELLKLSPEQQFEEIAEAISGLESATLRSASAQEIFGRSGTELLSVMQGGKKAILATKEEAESFNLVISQEFADASALFNDNMGRIGKLAKGTSNAFTQGLLPALLDVQEGFLGMERDFDVFRTAGEKVGVVVKTLATAFVIVKESALLFGRVLLGTVVAVFNALRAAAAPITGLITSIAEAMRSLSTGDFTGALNAIKEIPGTIANEFNAAVGEIREASGFLNQQFKDEIPAALERVNKFFNTHAKVVDSTAGAYGDMGDQTEKTTKTLKAWSERQKNASKLIEQNIKFVEDLEQAHADYNERLQDFIDIGDPVTALVREFTRQVEFADRALAAGDITIDQYRASLNALSDALGRNAASLVQTSSAASVMTEAMLEGVRILERSFTSMWDGILSGSTNAFDGMLDGFRNMLANMLHQLTTGKISKQLQNLFDPNEIFDAGEFASGLSGAIGSVLGSILGGGGQGAGIGSALGSIVGGLTPLGPIGSLIGGALGGLLGGLFDKDRPLVLEVSAFSKANESTSDDDTFVDTIFGRSFIRSRRLDAAAINEFKEQLSSFDELIGSFVNDSQVAAISDALAGWSEKIAGESLTIEELLNSRFSVILSTFSEDLQKFVNEASALEDRVARLQVGAGAESLFADQPGLFSGHSINEFLAVVAAFESRTVSIVDAFKQVLTILDVIASVQTTLTDFANSNLRNDYATMVRLQSESVVDTLTRLTSGLDDAIRNFDGSPQQLVEIGNLAQSIREQELSALTLIDSVAKGLNANLDRLLEDTRRTIEGPRAAEDILFDARALISTVSKAQTPEEIAEIGQQFEALIRQLTPDDVKDFGTSTLAIIEAFQAASNTALDNAKQAILDSGEAIRDMVDGFAQMIDPLEIIASTNERAAAALESIAAGQNQEPVDVLPTDPIEQANTTADNISAQFQENLNDQNQILLDGTTNMTNALNDGVSGMSRQLAAAIRSGFAGANVTVNVVVEDSLTTQ